MRYKCKLCNHVFSLTSGTVFSNTKIPLTIWYYAMHVFTAARKHVSSVQLARDMGVSQVTAYNMTMKFRALLTQSNSQKLGGVVEIDEGYFGSQWSGWRVGRPKYERMVLGMKQRGGDVRLIQIPERSAATLHAVIDEYVEVESEIHTDKWRPYIRAVSGRSHQSVDHKKGEWVRGGVTTNSIEATWGRMKKAIRYAHHSVSGKRLQSYCDEFAFKENTRSLTDEERFYVLLLLALNPPRQTRIDEMM